MVPVEDDSTAQERLNRYMARSGVGSRRRADDLIAEGRVRLNGEVVEKMATRVQPGVDTVTLDGKVLKPEETDELWVVMNKKAGTITARKDARGKPTIFASLPQSLRGLIAVGRLDFDTEGVILLTSDGYGAHRLMHPRYRIERVYEAHVAGTPPTEKLRLLAQGIDLGDPTPARAVTRITGKHRRGAIVQLVLKEGRKREIKRMMKAIDHPVLYLKRIIFAGVTTRGLKAGEWRRLTKLEVKRLKGLPQASGATDAC